VLNQRAQLVMYAMRGPMRAVASSACLGFITLALAPSAIELLCVAIT